MIAAHTVHALKDVTSAAVLTAVMVGFMLAFAAPEPDAREHVAAWERGTVAVDTDGVTIESGDAKPNESGGTEPTTKKGP